MDSTIIGALIGAAATILAAFISKDYAQRRVESTAPDRPLDKVTTTILQALSRLTVRSARIIRLKIRKVHVDQELGLVLVLSSVGSSWAHIDASTFDGHEFKLEIHLGSVVNYDVSGIQYCLILIYANWYKDTAQIQVRKR
jgi:hypothetical protein